MREKQTLLFDMDGVLVDVSNSYRLAIKKTAEDFTDTAVSLEEIQSYKEKTGFNNDWDLTEAIIQSRGKNVPKHWVIIAWGQITPSQQAKLRATRAGFLFVIL